MADLGIWIRITSYNVCYTKLLRFMKFAKRTQSPILPIHIKARNSALFYGASWLYRPLATMLLAKEMFSARNSVVEFTVGEMIGIDTINDSYNFV